MTSVSILSRWSSSWSLGKEIGIVLTTPLVSQLCASTFLGGWPSAFYVTGAVLSIHCIDDHHRFRLGLLSCLWFVGWALFAFNSPAEHPRITYEEKLFLLRSVPKPIKVRISRWRRVSHSECFLSLPHLGVTFSPVCHSTGSPCITFARISSSTFSWHHSRLTSRQFFDSISNKFVVVVIDLWTFLWTFV